MMAKRHIRRFVGELTEGNFDRILSVVTEDDFIGLDVLVQRELFDDDRGDRLSASVDDGKIILSQSSLEEGGIELNINQAFTPQWATYRIDGIFSIKSGGMFQGVVCMGLVPVHEAVVKLNPEVQVVELDLGAA